MINRQPNIRRSRREKKPTPEDTETGKSDPHTERQRVNIIIIIIL